jgi:hypothetical protein
MQEISTRLPLWATIVGPVAGHLLQLHQYTALKNHVTISTSDTWCLLLFMSFTQLIAEYRWQKQSQNSSQVIDIPAEYNARIGTSLIMRPWNHQMGRPKARLYDGTQSLFLPKSDQTPTQLSHTYKARSAPSFLNIPVAVASSFSPPSGFACTRFSNWKAGASQPKLMCAKGIHGVKSFHGEHQRQAGD